MTGTLERLALLVRAAGFRPALRYDGQDVSGLLALVTAGQGIALLPARVVGGGVPLAAPRLVHRTELIAVDPPAGVVLS